MCLLGSCTINTQKDSPTDSKAYTSEYVCPMHCENSGSDSMGNCPVCGMEYIKNKKSSNK